MSYQNELYLDTHAVIWLFAKDLHRFSDKVLSLLPHHKLLISPMVKLELQYLYEIKRLNYTPEQILSSLEDSIHLSICPKNWLSIINQAIHCDFTRDAFDRLIVAHAMLDNSILISKDERLSQHYAYCVW